MQIMRENSLFKTRLCHKFLEGTCAFSSERCNYAHGRDDLRPGPIEFEALDRDVKICSQGPLNSSINDSINFRSRKNENRFNSKGGDTYKPNFRIPILEDAPLVIDGPNHASADPLMFDFYHPNLMHGGGHMLSDFYSMPPPYSIRGPLSGVVLGPRPPPGPPPSSVSAIPIGEQSKQTLDENGVDTRAKSAELVLKTSYDITYFDKVKSFCAIFNLGRAIAVHKCPVSKKAALASLKSTDAFVGNVYSNTLDV